MAKTMSLDQLLYAQDLLRKNPKIRPEEIVQKVSEQFAFQFDPDADSAIGKVWNNLSPELKTKGQEVFKAMSSHAEALGYRFGWYANQPPKKADDKADEKTDPKAKESEAATV